MGKYAVRRLVASVPVIVIVSVAVFGMMRLLPGDPALALLSGSVSGGTAVIITQEDLERVRHELGIDRPIVVQYADWAFNALQGDLGDSFYTKRSVSSEMARRIPVSVELGAFAMVFSLMLAVPAGIVAAVKRDTWIDYPLRVFSILGLAAPNFWVATIGVVFASLWFGVAPPLKYESPVNDLRVNLTIMLWPALVLALSLMATVTRMIRATLLETLRQDYVRTAKAKGLGPTRVVVQHALRNALIPVVTLIGAQIGGLLSGSLIMEQIFQLPGIGRLAIQSIFERDYQMLQGVVLMFALIVVVSNLIVDLSYALLDPRIRYE